MIGETIEITILNWEKYNERKNLKASSWFRLSHDLFERPSFYALTRSELCFWIYLLCLASRRSSAVLGLNLAHARTVGRFKKPVVAGAIRKLEQIQAISVNNSQKKRPTLHNRRKQDETKQNTTEHNSSNGGVKPAPEPGKNIPTWDAYRDAYAKRYGEPPVRNATVNAKIAQFVSRVGIEDSPGVAAFYLTHNNSYYVQRMHPVGQMLQDAEKLRTEWVTGTRMTGQTAREVERKQQNSDNLYEAARILNERRKNNETL